MVVQPAYFGVSGFAFPVLGGTTPSAAPARVVDLCDQVAALVSALWGPLAPDAVTRVYGPDVGLTPDEPDTLITGRQVYVFADAYEVPESADRGSLWWDYAAAVLVVERYTDAAGAPPTAWVDARVKFVEESVFRPLRDPTLTLTGAAVAGAFPDPERHATVDVVYDQEVLIQHRAFWSLVRVYFKDTTDNTGG